MLKHRRRHRSGRSNERSDDIPTWALSFDEWLRQAVIIGLIGVGGALFAVWIGYQAFTTGHFTFSRWGFRTAVFNGPSARVIGVAFITAGASIHFNFFWGSLSGIGRYARKAGYAVGAVAVTLYLIAWGIQIMRG